MASDPNLISQDDAIKLVVLPSPSPTQPLVQAVDEMPLRDFSQNTVNSPVKEQKLR